jgi:hypothetical protein
MRFDLRGIGAIAIVVAAAACPALAGEEFSIAGTYVQNTSCKGDGSDPKKMVVRITEADVHSSFGVCTFVRKEFDGNALKAQMSCEGPAGNMLLGDVRFTLRADKNIDFVDQDHTYNVVLHRCPQSSAAQQQPASTSAR